MKEGEGERARKRGLRGGQTAGLFLPDEQITHTITALTLSAPVTDAVWMLLSPSFI